MTVMTPSNEPQQAAIAEANRRIQQILDEFDLQIAFREECVNGIQINAGFILIQRPPRIAVAGAVRQAVRDMSQ